MRTRTREEAEVVGGGERRGGGGRGGSGEGGMWCLGSEGSGSVPASDTWGGKGAHSCLPATALAHTHAAYSALPSPCRS